MNKKEIGEFILLDNIILELRDKSGKILSKEELHNDIVNSGKERVAKLLSGVSSSYFSHIAIGIGTTGVTTGDTSLETEIKRVAPTISYEADYKATFEYLFTFESGEVFAITEAGIFDNLIVSGSTMLDRFVFTAKNVDLDTDLYIKITITISA